MATEVAVSTGKVKMSNHTALSVEYSRRSLNFPPTQLSFGYGRATYFAKYLRQVSTVTEFCCPAPAVLPFFLSSLPQMGFISPTEFPQNIMCPYFPKKMTLLSKIFIKS